MLLKQVVPTDTCKNTVYCVASKNKFASIEEFGLQLCTHFLTEYPHIVNKVNVEIVSDNWERIRCPQGRGHKHAFRRIGPMKPYTHVQGTKKPSTPMTFAMQSGFKGLDIMKTTQSGFVNFHRDQYTTLPDDDDRLLGTSMDAEWDVNDNIANSKRPFDFNKVNFLFYDYKLALEDLSLFE